MTADAVLDEADIPTLGKVRELLFGDQLRALNKEIDSRDEASRKALHLQIEALSARIEQIWQEVSDDRARVGQEMAEMRRDLIGRVDTLQMMLEGTQLSRVSMASLLRAMAERIDQQTMSVNEDIARTAASR